MRKIFCCSEHSNENLLKALQVYPFTCYVVPVCDGYICFDSISEYKNCLDEINISKDNCINTKNNNPPLYHLCVRMYRHTSTGIKRMMHIEDSDTNPISLFLKYQSLVDSVLQQPLDYIAFYLCDSAYQALFWTNYWYDTKGPKKIEFDCFNQTFKCFFENAE